MHKASAKKLINIAVTLESLPVIMDTFAQGHLPWAKVVHLVDFATPETDAELAEEAQYLSVRELETRASVAKLDPNKHEDAHQYRKLTFFTRGERWYLNGNLPLDLGAIVQGGIEQVADQEGLDAQTGEYRPLLVR
jgi:hypothetical protein